MLRAAMAAEQKPASDLVASKNVQPKVEGSAEGVENVYTIIKIKK
jgi:hypothetical protein